MNKSDDFKTTCSYCGVGCGIIAEKDKKGKPKVSGDPDHPVNKGMLCSKGMNLHYVAEDHSDRLQYPQMRWGKNHPLERVDWAMAMERAGAVFKSIIKMTDSLALSYWETNLNLRHSKALLRIKQNLGIKGLNC